MNKYIFILSQPRSGSTLLLRLLRMGCRYYATGDNKLSMYESLITISEDFAKDGEYGCLITREKTGEHSGNIRDTKLDNDSNFVNYYLKALLYRTSSSPACAKTTKIGFGNDLTERFVDMLRTMHSISPYAIPFKLVILTRNHDDIIKSLKLGADDSLARSDLQDQLSQFRSCYDLDDSIIKYEDLVADPIKILNKIGVVGKIDVEMVHKIMQNKIKP